VQLTGSDETDLLLPLYAGVHDQTGWSTFLERLRRRTGADFASLIFAQGDTPIHLSKEVFVGRDLRAEAQSRGLLQLYQQHRIPYKSLRPGRVYQLTELVAGDVDAHHAYEVINQQMGLSDERVVRIKEREGTSAWLMVARSSDQFTAADGALMNAVAPHVAIALRSFILAERQRVEGAAVRDGLSRAGLGWIVLSRDARVIDFDPGLTPLLFELQGSGNLVGERLHVATQPGQIVAQAALDFASDPRAPPRAAVLREDPRLDALLVPIADRPCVAPAIPVLALFCRISRPGTTDRTAMVQQLFGLSNREAELCLKIADGQSLAHAASAMSLTTETARSYIKNVFAKMDVAGQSQLILRLVTSSAWLA
jgi:DNA-binding CsgD family transcriptional regulator